MSAGLRIVAVLYMLARFVAATAVASAESLARLPRNAHALFEVAVLGVPASAASLPSASVYALARDDIVDESMTGSGAAATMPGVVAAGSPGTESVRSFDSLDSSVLSDGVQQPRDALHVVSGAHCLRPPRRSGWASEDSTADDADCEDSDAQRAVRRSKIAAASAFRSDGTHHSRRHNASFGGSAPSTPDVAALSKVAFVPPTAVVVPFVEPRHLAVAPPRRTSSYDAAAAAGDDAAPGGGPVAARRRTASFGSVSPPPLGASFGAPTASPAAGSSATSSSSSSAASKIIALDIDDTLFCASRSRDAYGCAPTFSEVVVTAAGAEVYHVWLRPHGVLFLKCLAQWYTVVAFTASMPQYADPLLDRIERMCGYRVFKRRYYRQQCVPLPAVGVPASCSSASTAGGVATTTMRTTAAGGTRYAKDLRHLGVKLSRVVLLDNCADSFRLQPECGFLVPSFRPPRPRLFDGRQQRSTAGGTAGGGASAAGDDVRDAEFVRLLPVLEALSHASDVRAILQYGLQ